MRKLSSCKKGQLGLLTPAIVTLIIAAVILIIGLVILSSILNTSTIRESGTFTVNNESILDVNDSAIYAVSRSDSQAFGSFTVIRVLNSSVGADIPLSNITVTANGTIQWNNGAGGNNGFNGSDWNVTYSYTRGGGAFEAANQTIFGIGTFGDFWEIIVLALVATIIIGLLLGGLGSLGRRR